MRLRQWCRSPRITWLQLAILREDRTQNRTGISHAGDSSVVSCISHGLTFLSPSRHAFGGPKPLVVKLPAFLQAQMRPQRMGCPHRGTVTCECPVRAAKKSLESSGTNYPLQLSTAQMKTSTIRRLRKQPILLTKCNLSDRIHSPVIATRRAQTIYKLSTTFHPALRVCTSAKELAGSAKGRRTRQGVSAMWLDPN